MIKQREERSEDKMLITKSFELCGVCVCIGGRGRADTRDDEFEQNA